ncbi:MAG: hypothetical protein IKC31_07920 [Clostridia bacterium]|nr:hypothetical protein [Clostridia bacterium]
MNSDNKRIIICLPNQPILSGLMTLENAKSLAKAQSPDIAEFVLIIVMDVNNDVISCYERNAGTWTEKEIKSII